MVYQTRSRTEQMKMEEAAQTLLELSQSTECISPLPRRSPRLQRTMSHEDEAYSRSMEIAPRTRPGDTILMNFYTDRYYHTTVKYMKNENNSMVIHTIQAPRDAINIAWTYEVTDFPFY